MKKLICKNIYLVIKEILEDDSIKKYSFNIAKSNIYDKIKMLKQMTKTL